MFSFIRKTFHFISFVDKNMNINSCQRICTVLWGVLHIKTTMPLSKLFIAHFENSF